MNTYAVTFRIANRTVGGRTYQDRYDALNAELQNSGGGLWFDTTSFYLVESDETTFEFGERLVRGLDETHDMLAAFDPKDMSACYFGNIAAEDVFRGFFFIAKKLG